MLISPKTRWPKTRLIEYSLTSLTRFLLLERLGEVEMEVEGPTDGAVAVGRGALGMAAADLTDMDTTVR